MSPHHAPYGYWESPITSDLLIQKAVKLDDAIVDPTTGRIFHIEGRPEEGGRNAIADSVLGKDVIGKEFDVRTQVQEYGGGQATAYGGKIIFSNVPDNQLYSVDYVKGSSPESICPENANWRYTDMAVHPHQQNLVIAVLEDHTKPHPSKVQTRLVVVNADMQSVRPLSEGADFYSSPKISPDCKHLAYVQWFHPDMPWEGGEVVIASLRVIGEGTGLEVGDGRLIAGKRGVSAAQQPEWITNDRLGFLSNESGFLNPYSFNITDGKGRSVLAQPVSEDFGEPHWLLGTSSYAFLDEMTAIYTSVRGGYATLYHVDLSDGSLRDLKAVFAEITRVRRVSNDSIVFRGQKVDQAEALVHYQLSTGSYKVIKETSNLVSTLPEGIVSIGKAMSLPTLQSDELIHVLYYAPANPGYSSHQDEIPPCIVNIHGGPTHRTSPGLKWEKQFFTSRGFAWLDVNYGGSTGYGTKYIDRLRGLWGVVDVEDTIQAVSELCNRGVVDRKRIFIRGGSAGGFTVLNALTAYPNFFAAGVSIYGISDMARLAESTHKFQSHYIDKLIGGSLAQEPQLYEERSPVFRAVRVKAPLLILQGSVDKVVPAEQAKAMVDVIKKGNGVVKYFEFEGEGHGWRQGRNIKAALEAELDWYKQVLGLP